MATTFEKYEEKLTEYLLKTVRHTNRCAPEVQILKPEVMLQTIVIADLLDEIKGLRSDINSMKEEIKELVSKPVAVEVEESGAKGKGKGKDK